MSERFDRWCMVMGGQVQGAYADRKQAEERAKIIGADVIRLVEIRDGEPHPDDVGMMLADAKLRSDAATERAEKAEAEVKRLTIDDQRYVSVKTLEETRAAYDAVCRAAVKRADQAEATVMARDVEIDTLRSILKQFEDGGMSGREVREAQNDAAAKFERWAAVRFHAVSLAQGDGDFSAIVEARKFRSHYFGAKEV